MRTANRMDWWRAVREIKAVARSLRFAASELHGTDIGAKHPILPWLVAYGSAVINRSQRSTDGLTPSRRWKGAWLQAAVAAVSEVVSYLPNWKEPE